ncbi:ParB N-terminal domain-containing protein, partial [Escherichia coli]
ASLTPKSLKSIRSTIKHQQFYPAIGVRRATGKIEILDGSRRRASAILENRVAGFSHGPGDQRSGSAKFSERRSDSIAAQHSRNRSAFDANEK